MQERREAVVTGAAVCKLYTHMSTRHTGCTQSCSILQSSSNKLITQLLIYTYLYTYKFYFSFYQCIFFLLIYHFYLIIILFSIYYFQLENFLKYTVSRVLQNLVRI